MKKMNKFSKMLTLMVAMATLMFACVDDDYDRPDIEQIPVGQIYTIQQIKDLYNGSTYKFTDDASVYATVTMDNETDNSYRTFFIQDNTGAIAVFQDVSGGVYIGDSVRIYLKNLVVMQYQKLFQINSVSGDGVNVDDNLIKQGYNNKRSPEDATIQDIKDNMAYYQGRLVKISDVQFVDTDIDKTFADAENLETEERKIQDTYDNQLIVRTSGYATFANSDVPDGSGSIIAIVGQYGETIQLYIRRVSELEMDNERFEITQPPVEGVTSFNVDFENLSDYDDVEITGWQSFAEVGSRLWQAKEFSGNVYAQGSAYTRNRKARAGLFNAAQRHAEASGGRSVRRRTVDELDGL